MVSKGNITIEVKESHGKKLKKAVKTLGYASYDALISEMQRIAMPQILDARMPGLLTRDELLKELM